MDRQTRCTGSVSVAWPRVRRDVQCDGAGPGEVIRAGGRFPFHTGRYDPCERSRRDHDLFRSSRLGHVPAVFGRACRPGRSAAAGRTPVRPAPERRSGMIRPRGCVGVGRRPRPFPALSFGRPRHRRTGSAASESVRSVGGSRSEAAGARKQLAQKPENGNSRV